MIGTGFFITCVLIILFSVIRFGVAYFRGEPGHLKWLVPIPVTGVVYIAFLFLAFLIGW
ncbi:hypothetical protein [Aneurinibacillus tyrosinisolvens]|jgi:hypothetical protein|uniref:hypothetical protein n=1 Tax=Aneurinibacillus tyrosinisolvens TaxID=1443435 RepID=UPI000A3F2F48|nr:hypothetical protein [Aneurinibacillus tyrosinisolvens]